MEETVNIARLDIRRGPTGSFYDYNVPVLTREKDGKWFAHCPLFKSLGYSTVSEEDAIEDQHRDIALFFKVHVKLGTLERALKNLGWERKAKYDEGFETVPSIQVLRASQPVHGSYAFA